MVSAIAPLVETGGIALREVAWKLAANASG